MRVVCLDFGERRIGIAVSDASRTLARPLHTIAPGASLAERVTAVVAEIVQLAGEPDGLAAIVVGLPVYEYKAIIVKSISNFNEKTCQKASFSL